ncbi:MAG: guanylate kinase [Candidatus Omnitrophota bacterium]
MKKQSPGQGNRKKARGLIFVISGPSGSGKTTLAERILKDKVLGNSLRKSVSFTTRPKRSGERHRQDYFFLTESRFKQQVKAKKILEWTNYLGYYYGTPKSSVDSQISKGRHLLLCIDLKGAKNLKRLYPKNTVTIFVVPPSLAELRKRIKNRCSKTAEHEVRRRLERAKKEIPQAARFDYRLKNKDLKKTVRQLKDIILNRISLLSRTAH